MKKNFTVFGLLCLFVFGMNILQAQEGVTASGGNGSGSGGSVSYTIGQTVYTYNNGSTGTVTQGIQQSYQISIVNSIRKITETELACSVHPNPAGSFLKLTVNTPAHFKALNYKLIDLNSKIMSEGKADSPEITIKMDDFVPSVYFLKVYDDQSEIATFKIIKK